MARAFLAFAGTGALAVAFATVSTNDAHACGGCFHEEVATQTQSTVVTGHRMALSISRTQTVLWDQVQYAGSPEDFAWVLPIKPGARIEVATDAWFDVLEAATAVRVQSPPLDCSGNTNGGNFAFDDYEGGSGCDLGCSSDDTAGGAPMSGFGSGSGGKQTPPPPPPVEVVHQGTAGPYETVTVHANEQGALANWLTSHGYAIDDDIQPIIDAYTSEGFDFIALRLAPGSGVQQMKPVRVISSGAAPTLPLRMVAAGTGPFVAITLFVIGEGRWETANFPNDVLDPKNLDWSFGSQSSNYAALRDDALLANDGRTWITSYAVAGSLLSPSQDPLTGTSVAYSISDGSVQSTIGEAYFAQGFANDEDGGSASIGRCMNALTSIASSTQIVVDPCPGDPSEPGGGGGAGGTGSGGSAGSVGAGGEAGSSGGGGAGGSPECGEVGPDATDARSLACGSLDDLSVALTGMHPADVWLTRLESNLPRAALADDLEMDASPSQVPVANEFVAATSSDGACPVASGATLPPKPSSNGPSRRERRDRRMIFVAAAFAASALARRFARWRFRAPATAAS